MPTPPPPFGEPPERRDGTPQKSDDDEVSSIVDKAKQTRGNSGVTASTKEAAERAADEFVEAIANQYLSGQLERWWAR
jgi:hypothetical protein